MLRNEEGNAFDASLFVVFIQVKSIKENEFKIQTLRFFFYNNTMNNAIGTCFPNHAIIEVDFFGLMTLYLFITRKLVNFISLDIIKQYDTNMLLTKPSEQDQNTYMVLCSIFPNKTYRDLYVIPLQNIYHQLIIISLFNISSSFSKIKILTQRMLKKNPAKMKNIIINSLWFHILFH